MPVCTYCQSVDHTQFYCKRKPRAQLKTTTRLQQTKPLKTTARIKKFGPVTRAWMRTRGDWLTRYPAPWHCHYCGKSLDITSITLDHKIPRSRAPQLRHDLTNLVAACWICNGLKGSVAHDEYVHDCH